ncbi:MAG TPA: Bro-N domain-containing protein [Rhabdochlamydiaceae bacterium]|nr:Bro-N domain-containing protein [Rhabdochlamydiaceae bacterium]
MFLRIQNFKIVCSIRKLMKSVDKITEMGNKIAVFEDENIRRIFHKGEWFFSIIDIVRVLTESSDPSRYWTELRTQLANSEGFVQLFGKIEQLKLESSDGKKYKTDTANTETVFRIIQSIPSPKAEPFKRWLAQVGYERIQEIEDPELATKRTRAIYKAKGYSDEWIEKRMRGIAIREELTDEWDKRGVKIQREYAILTAEISKATFGMTPTEYKQHKGLERENLRDHMTDLELIFSMLGEAATKEIAVNRDAQGFDENKNAAKMGGRIARNARLELEEESGKPVISKENYLERLIPAPGEQKLLESDGEVE